MLHLTLLLLVAIILAIAYAGHNGAGSSPRPVTRCERNPSWITPLLVCMVIAIGFFGMLGAVQQTRRVAQTKARLAGDFRRGEPRVEYQLPRQMKAEFEKFKKALTRGHAHPLPEPVQPAEPAEPAATEPTGPQPLTQCEVVGLGETQGEADAEALKKARNAVQEFFQTDVSIPDSLVNDKLVTQRDTNPPQHTEAVAGHRYAYRTKLTLKIMPATAEEILHMEKQASLQHRVLLTAKILGSLLAILLTVALYVRIDEWSKGYYTGWLRLAAAGFITASGLGLWLIAGS